MRALGHHKKPRLADGRIHYQGLAWKDPDTGGLMGPRDVGARRQVASLAGMPF